MINESDDREVGVRFVNYRQSIITDRIGQREVLFPINHKYYTFQGSYKGQKAGDLTKFSIYDFV